MTITSIQSEAMTAISIIRSLLNVTIPTFDITQAVWYVDTDNGNDGADGATLATALKTLPGFTTRNAGGTFTVPTTINISGDHTDEPLQGYFQLGPSAALTFNGTTPTELDTGTLTDFTALTTTEGTLAEVSGKDWTTAGPGGTSLIGKRIRMTSGAALGMVAWIIKDAPGGAASDIVRTSRFGDVLTPLTRTVTYINPSIGDTYTVEDLTPIGGIDMIFTQDSSALREVVIQFNDVDTTPSVASTNTVVPGAASGMLILRSKIGSALAGLGSLNPALCHWSGGLAGLETTGLVLRGCLVTSDFFGQVIVQGSVNFTAIDTVFQGVINSIRVPISTYQRVQIFDTAIGVTLDFCACLRIRDTLDGSGITDVGVRLRSSASMLFESLPTLTGPVNAIRIGGTDFTSYTLGEAGSPVNGAGLFEYL